MSKTRLFLSLATVAVVTALVSIGAAAPWPSCC